jgi:hypothetical protein
MGRGVSRPAHGVRKYQTAVPHSPTNQAVEIQTSTSSRFIRVAPQKDPPGTYREAPMPAARRTTERQECIAERIHHRLNAGCANPA